jgi:NAD(P)-dependent dehydrogenase (short-subunit alcohol dehydrogenase family)
MEGRLTNRVLVIGAQGALGAWTVRAFSEAGWTVRSAARRPRRGQIRIDLDRPESVQATLVQDELVVNTVPHADLFAERHILEHGGTVINASALPAAAGRSLRAVAGAARGTVVMNAGLAPGVTTIVAADLLRLHPEAGELEIVYTLSLTTPRGPASADFIHRGLTTVTRHQTAVVPLPRPFGNRVCLGFGEDDAGWLGGIAEGRIVRQYICVSESAIHERLLDVNGAGGMNKLPRSLVGPRKQSAHASGSDEPIAHWIAAIRGGRRLGVRTVQCRGDFLHAARSTVVLAEALPARDRRGGCFDPEEIWTLSAIDGKLQAAGITVVPQSVSAVDR